MGRLGPHHHWHRSGTVPKPAFGIAGVADQKGTRAKPPENIGLTYGPWKVGLLSGRQGSQLGIRGLYSHPHVLVYTSWSILPTSSVCVPPSECMNVTFSTISGQFLSLTPGVHDHESESCIGGHSALGVQYFGKGGSSCPTNSSFTCLEQSITCRFVHKKKNPVMVEVTLYRTI